MEVGNLDLVGVPVTPLETDSPLVVDANAVLAGPISDQFLQAVTWGDAEIFHRLGGIQKHQLPEGGSLDGGGQLLNLQPVEEALRLLVAETFFHDGKS